MSSTAAVSSILSKHNVPYIVAYATEMSKIRDISVAGPSEYASNTTSLISVLHTCCVPHICVEAKYSRENDFLRGALAERDLKHDVYLIHEWGPAALYFKYCQDNNKAEYQKLVDASGTASPDRNDLFDAILEDKYVPSPGAVEEFLKNTSEDRLRQAIREDDESDSSVNFSLNNHGKLLPRNTWVGHFCSDARSIASHGFMHGEPDAYSLGLTRLKSDEARYGHTGYNFGFDVKTMRKNWQRGVAKYGKELVLFQTSGVSAYHSGDEEDQIIFWGPHIEWVVPIVPAPVENYEYQSDDDYAVLATDGSYAFRTSSEVPNSATYGFNAEKNCRACVEWVVKNINAYRKSLIWYLPKNTANTATDSGSALASNDMLHNSIGITAANHRIPSLEDLDEAELAEFERWSLAGLIRDEVGKPLLLFHGGDEELRDDDWWTPDLRNTREFGHITHCAYLRMNNPAHEEDLVAIYNELFATEYDWDDLLDVMDTTPADFLEQNQLYFEAVRKNHDGFIIFDNSLEHPGLAYRVFDVDTDAWVLGTVS